MLARVTAFCPTHPEQPALGNCQRCGTFFCAADRLDVDGVAYCSACGVRPDVDWVEAYRQAHLGKRDGWAWFFGLSAFGYLALCLSLLINGDGPVRLLAIPALASAVTGVLFFLGIPIARMLLIIAFLVWSAAQLALLGPLTLISSVFSATFVITALTATRTRLFFKLEVPRHKLKADYARLADNRLARNAFAIGVLSLLIPIFSPMAIICGAIAARRVDPHARPPVGKRGHAVAGIVLGVFGLGVAGVWAYAIFGGT